MATSLLETIRDGGCFWKRQPDSPGHSFAVPNQTPFKIALDGSQSNLFASGMCRDGYFVLDSGKSAGQKFGTASSATNAVRAPQTNAFLYVHFRVAGIWWRADDMRTSVDFRPDPVEELALRHAFEAFESQLRKRRKQVDEALVLKWAATVALTKPMFIEHARESIARGGTRLTDDDFPAVDDAVHQSG